MEKKHQPEVWMRGPLEGITPLLQAIAHALLQASEEADALMTGFPEILLWVKPAGMASAGFHLQHITGVINRLFTYARNEMLTTEQLDYLAMEGKTPQSEYGIGQLLAALDNQVAAAVEQLKATDTQHLTDARGIGRAKIPTTLMGLYVHAAEHTMRHIGQLLVTVTILKGGR
jgi:hypothetical protein